MEQGSHTIEAQKRQQWRRRADWKDREHLKSVGVVRYGMRWEGDGVHGGGGNGGGGGGGSGGGGGDRAQWRARMLLDVVSCQIGCGNLIVGRP